MFGLYSKNIYLLMLKKLSSNFIKLTALLLFTFYFSFGKLYAQAKTVGLTKHFNGGVEDGYVLFTPLGTDTTFLINKCGQKIHTWYSKYTPGLSVYLLPNGHLLKTGTYNDTAFGGAGGRGGIIEELDWDSKVVWRYMIFNDTLCQHHDIKPMPNGNVLVMTWHSISKKEAIKLGRSTLNFGSGQTDLWGERLVELKPKGKDSAEIIWQWDLYDHVIQDIDSTKANYGNVSKNPGLMNINYALNLKTRDWIHMNGIDYNEKLDQIVMSCHNISEIWVIDHGTTKAEAAAHSGGKYGHGGDFLYRWGNPIAYNKGTAADRKLFRQHNATWIPSGLKDSGCIILFNNGWDRDTAYSSIDIIKTPIFNGNYNNSLPYGPSNALWIYKDSIPKKFYSQIISGVQRLPNGNTLICSGVQGRFFEINQQKKIVWEYLNPSNGPDLQSDGENPNDNAVFRCVFYPNTYSGFKNKVLTSHGTVEKNSYVYSCIYETTPPKIVALTPIKNDFAIDLIAPLKITFDEAVLAKTGTIEIYQNNTLFQTISIPSSSVSISTKEVTINHSTFKANARVAVILYPGGFRDSSDNLSKGQDSSQWHFSTSKTQPIVDYYIPASKSVNVQLNSILQIHFKENVFKSGIGKVSIWENSIFKEGILSNSNQINITGNIVTITPSAPFALNATIVVEYDECFMDVNGIFTNPVIFGDWYFKTPSYPKLISLSPSHNAKGVTINTDLSITFDRNIYVGQKGNLLIYEKNTIKDSIEINGPRVAISGKTITFDINSDFNRSSWISVQLGADLLKDSIDTYFTGIDSSNWHFSSELKANTQVAETYLKANGLRTFPNPNQGNFTLISDKEIESIEVFDFTGKRMNITTLKSNDINYQIELSNAVAGHYLILVNNLYSINIVIE